MVAKPVSEWDRAQVAREIEAENARRLKAADVLWVKGTATCPKCMQGTVQVKYDGKGRYSRAYCSRACSWGWESPDYAANLEKVRRLRSGVEWNAMKYVVLAGCEASEKEGHTSVTVRVLAGRLGLDMARVSSCVGRCHRAWLLWQSERTWVPPQGMAFYYALQEHGTAWLAWARQTGFDVEALAAVYPKKAKGK